MRSVWSDRLELRFLFVAQCRVEVLSRAAHQLDGLEDGVQPGGDRGKPRRRRYRVIRLTGRLQHVGRLFHCIMQQFERGALGVVQVQPGIDFAARPLERGGLLIGTAFGKQMLLEADALRSIFGQRINPRLLFVIQQAIEFLQGRLHQCHCGNHRLDALLHGHEPAR